VIDSILYPYRIATSEWPNSWSSTQTKSPIAAADPSTHCIEPAVRGATAMVDPNRSLTTPANDATSLPMSHAKRGSTRRNVRSSLIGIPNALPIRMPRILMSSRRRDLTPTTRNGARP